MSFTIVDKRDKSGGKSLGNRQRFIRRVKDQLKKQINDTILDRSITSEGDHEVSVPSKGISEPFFGHDPNTGNTDRILPGNQDFIPGDVIPKPSGGSGSRGNKASDSGNGEDDFTFVLTKDEYYEILFDGLELPNLKDKIKADMSTTVKARAGFTNNGNPAQLDLVRSMKNGLGRRLALKKPSEEDLDELKSKIETEIDESKKKQLIDEYERLASKRKAISFIDPIDLRFRNYTDKPKPKTSAVMFCVMDVSGSMGQQEKDLAKRFYMLMYMFLKQKYKNIDVVFVKHHTEASECTEEEFFYSKETGGTIVSVSLDLVSKIQKERYSANEYNIYVSQCSDGDNWETDNEKVVRYLDDHILPVCQYFTYLEVGNSAKNRTYGSPDGPPGLWPVYHRVSQRHDNMDIRAAIDHTGVYQAFRDFFKAEL